jgi:hypothetical protein
MNERFIVLEQNEDDLFVNRISDEALEVAASAAQTANYTLGSCTGGTTCPPWTPVRTLSANRPEIPPFCYGS